MPSHIALTVFNIKCPLSRLLNVSNAWYADCNGLYSLTNLTAVWDKKRVVYQRIHGGINPGDMRYDTGSADPFIKERIFVKTVNWWTES